MQGIKITDKRPKDYEYVLVYGKYMDCKNCKKEWHIGYFSEVEKAFCISYNPSYKIEITHWMPLPEPPKE